MPLSSPPFDTNRSIGDHTSFQSFPTHLGDAVRSKLPPSFEVSSYLYPTYPSVRPIAHATEQLLAWSVAQIYATGCADLP